VYVWAFMDSPLTAPVLLSSLRSISVANSQCQFENDRELLRSKVLEHFFGHAEFERFAQFAGVAMIVQSLFLSPAIYNEERYRSFIQPLLDLADDLGFTSLSQTFRSFDAVGEWAKLEAQNSPDENPEYTAMVLTFIQNQIMPLILDERLLAVRTRA
jgi:hypothetical protein